MGCECKSQIPAAPPPTPPSSPRGKRPPQSEASSNIAIKNCAAVDRRRPLPLALSTAASGVEPSGGIGVGSVIPQGGMCDNGSGGGVMTTLLPLIEGKCKCQRRPKGKGLGGFDAAENKL